MDKERHQKILRYAELLAQNDPKRWEDFIQTVREHEGQFTPEEEVRRAKAVVKNWFRPDTGSIPKTKQWNGTDSKHDYPCYRCECIGEPGTMRYLGSFYAGQEKVCKELYDEEGEPYFADVEFPNYLDGWRCDLCGHEKTDGY